MTTDDPPLTRISSTFTRDQAAGFAVAHQLWNIQRHNISFYIRIDSTVDRSYAVAIWLTSDGQPHGLTLPSDEWWPVVNQSPTDHEAAVEAVAQTLADSTDLQIYDDKQRQAPDTSAGIAAPKAGA